MKLNEQVQRHVEATYLDPARRRGEDTIRVKAGDVHRDLHWTNRVPSVCTTLASHKFQRETGLELISKEGPPSGQSTTVVFTYRISSEVKTPQRLENQKSRFESLYGIAANTFRELGGGENFIRGERAALQFRKEDHPAKGEGEDR